MTKAAYHATSKAPLATEVDYARMQALLSKRTAPKVPVQVEEVARTPKAEPLEWEELKPGARGYYSLCRRYSVCSITIAGHDIFSAWKLGGGNWCYHEIAGGLKSFSEAEARAQSDADKRT